MVDDHVHVGPRQKLAMPMGNRRERSNDKERTADMIGVVDLVQKGDRLDSLAETHLICHNTCLIVEPAVEQPVQSLHLILPQLVAMLEWWRLLEFAESSPRRPRKLSGCNRVGNDFAGVKFINLFRVQFDNDITKLPG